MPANTDDEPSLEQRLGECHDEDAHEGIVAVEMTFALPVSITMAQYRRLCDVMDEITDAPWNQPVHGLHWFAEQGSKPRWSKADTAFMGRPADADAPDSGEPTFDHSVIALGSAARGFVTERERERTLKARERAAAAPVAVKSTAILPAGYTVQRCNDVTQAWCAIGPELHSECDTEEAAVRRCWAEELNPLRVDRDFAVAARLAFLLCRELTVRGRADLVEPLAEHPAMLVRLCHELAGSFEGEDVDRDAVIAMAERAVERGPVRGEGGERG